MLPMLSVNGNFHQEPEVILGISTSPSLISSANGIFRYKLKTIFKTIDSMSHLRSIF